MRLDANIPGAVDPEHWFAQIWAVALGEVVQALDLGSGAPPLEVRAGEADPEKWQAWEEPLWRDQSWTPGEDARLWIGCPAAVARALWAHIGGAADEDAEQAKETFAEMLNQSAAATANEASSRLGAPARAAAFAEGEPPESGWAVELHFQIDDADHTIAIVGNAAMAKALSPAEVEQPEVEAAPPPPQPPARQAPAAPPAPRRDPIELIREVSMELAVSFGDTSMPLVNVLELASGAIIELNRSVSDPVEVLVNGSVIARGDVVVVDGNYGVRITEIVSRRDRVRSML